MGNRHSSSCTDGSEEIKEGKWSFLPGTTRPKASDDAIVEESSKRGLFNWVDEYFYPKSRLTVVEQRDCTSRIASADAQSSTTPRYPHSCYPQPSVLLFGCSTIEDHYARIKEILKVGVDRYGEEGLRRIGFEYRFVPCDAHRIRNDNEQDQDQQHPSNFEYNQANGSVDLAQIQECQDTTHESASSLQLVTESFDSVASEASSTRSSLDIHSEDLPLEDVGGHHCFRCSLRLCHIDSDTFVTDKNRRKVIADGDMYELVTKLAMQNAHEVMMKEGDLEWKTVEQHDQKESIRALVSRGHTIVNSDGLEGRIQQHEDGSSHCPTLMIATGRGKVRAGIFSRHHLICSSMESSTALPIVREALIRGMNIVIPDPNVHGERDGYESFRKTMQSVFRQWEEPTCDIPLGSRDLYILSHSASGGQLARYLLDKSDAYLPHVKAIAFTDSTHNIQWAKTHQNEQLYSKLESPECVYFRCASVRSEDTREWHLDPPGKAVQTDSFWKRRFGNIKTYSAGTKEHSLTNWYAHSKIWEHFDHHLDEKGTAGEDVPSEKISESQKEL